MAHSTLFSCLFLLVIISRYYEIEASVYDDVNEITRPKGCGCLYNIFANMPAKERERRGHLANIMESLPSLIKCIKTCVSRRKHRHKHKLHKHKCSADCIYSSVNGKCNNRCNPDWGMSFRPFGRLLKPDYCESRAPDALRCAKDGTDLPSARTLSLELFQERPPKPLDKFLTSAHMAFGQFLSHDFGRKNEPKPTDANGVNLCGVRECNKNAVCFPIEVFTGDPDFNSNRCLRFQRSTRNDTPDHACKEQQNDVTSYMDLNTVYGSTMDELILLRDSRPEFSAYMNTTSFSQVNIPGKQGKPFLPQTDGIVCRNKSATVKCFLAGDIRVKEQPQLTVFHTILVREHNRLVKELDDVNGGCWSQERLFQEARKINMAMWQYIVYDEYLPLFFSETVLDFWRLRLKHNGFSNAYDKRLNASTSNVFMTASFRFSHTQIPEFMPLADSNFNIYLNRSFSEHFNNPYIFYDSLNRDVTPVDAVSFGMIALSAEASDSFFNKQITRSFDADTKDAPSRDLEALDIKRGRDHALPGYNDWLKFCGLTYAVNSFNEFIYLDTATRAQFATLYNHVDDVDLFVAGVREIPLPGDLSGPVLTCLNAEQFHRTRFGDRFWHEERTNGFTLPQLNNIRQITMARIFCDNLDDAKTMQPFILAHPRSVAEALFSDVMSEWDFNMVYNEKLKSNNERVPCHTLPQLDFSLWKEKGCWNAKCDKHHRYPNQR